MNDLRPGESVGLSQYQDRWSAQPEDRCSDVLSGKRTGQGPTVTHYQPTNQMINEQ